MQQRAECYSSLRVQFIRYNLNTMSLNDLKQLLPADIHSMPIPQELKNYCMMILQRVDVLSCQIAELDTYLKDVTLEDPKFKILLTIPGVLYVLGLTIYYEIGDITRFDNVRQFASYCRLVPGISQSSYHGSGRQGTDCSQGSLTREEVRSPALPIFLSL